MMSNEAPLNPPDVVATEGGWLFLVGGTNDVRSLYQDTRERHDFAGSMACRFARDV